MKLVCKYCGHVIEYDNGHGWFPGYVTKMYNHIFGEHIKIEQFVDSVSDSITYQARIDPGYSAVKDLVRNIVCGPNGLTNETLTVSENDREHPPAYSTPTKATVKSDA